MGKIIFDIIKVVGVIFTIIFTSYYVVMMIWFFTPFRPFKRIVHDVFGIHDPDPNDNGDKDSVYTCQYCGKHIKYSEPGGPWYVIKEDD